MLTLNVDCRRKTIRSVAFATMRISNARRPASHGMAVKHAHIRRVLGRCRSSSQSWTVVCSPGVCSLVKSPAGRVIGHGEQDGRPSDTIHSGIEPARDGLLISRYLTWIRRKENLDLRKWPPSPVVPATSAAMSVTTPRFALHPSAFATTASSLVRNHLA